MSRWKLKKVAIELVDFANADRITLEFTREVERQRLFIDLVHGATPDQIVEKTLNFASQVEKLK